MPLHPPLPGTSITLLRIGKTAQRRLSVSFQRANMFCANFPRHHLQFRKNLTGETVSKLAGPPPRDTAIFGKIPGRAIVHAGVRAGEAGSQGSEFYFPESHTFPMRGAKGQRRAMVTLPEGPLISIFAPGAARNFPPVASPGKQHFCEFFLLLALSPSPMPRNRKLTIIFFRSR